jgi:hypothetical protein
MDLHKINYGLIQLPNHVNERVINISHNINFRKRMKTNQTPAVLYKDFRFWLVIVLTFLLIGTMIATYPA